MYWWFNHSKIGSHYVLPPLFSVIWNTVLMHVCVNTTQRPWRKKASKQRWIIAFYMFLWVRVVCQGPQQTFTTWLKECSDTLTVLQHLRASNGTTNTTPTPHRHTHIHVYAHTRLVDDENLMRHPDRDGDEPEGKGVWAQIQAIINNQQSTARKHWLDLWILDCTWTISLFIYWFTVHHLVTVEVFLRFQF